MDALAHVSCASALSRATDPETSAEAARQVEASGAAGTHREIILAEVRRLSGQTSGEIASRTGIERHETSRRLSDLCRAGLVISGAPRRCNACGTRQMTWNSPASEPGVTEESPVAHGLGSPGTISRRFACWF